MARIALGALTTLNTSTHLDPMFVELYELRDRITTPSYSAGSAAISLGAAATSYLNLPGSGQAAPPSGLNYGLFPQSSVGLGISSLVSIAFWTGGTPAQRLLIGSTGHTTPGADNTQTLGSGSLRWSTVYAGTGSINTSDAREKTAVESMTPAEVAASRDLAREIGTYRFLSAVAAKGDDARVHVGMTVQRAIEVMESHGLDPMRYGFICHDQWPERIEQIPAVTEPHPTLVMANGDPVLVEVSPAREEVIPAGDRYAFRPDELLLFIARGLEARLTALEQAA
jgi:hypothetical protein